MANSVNTSSTQYKNVRDWVKETTNGELYLRTSWDNISGGMHQLDRTNPKEGQKRRYINAGTLKGVKSSTKRFIDEEI